MAGAQDGMLGVAAWLSVGLWVLAVAGAFCRILRGPSRAERVVAVDLRALLTICFIGVYAVMTDRAAYLDIAIDLALVAFLGTVAFARYAERRERDSGELPPGSEADDAG